MKGANDRFYVVIGLVAVISALTLLTASRLFDQDNDAELCVLHELIEHRQNNYAADRDQAASDRRPFNVPAPPPPMVVPTDLAAACERFLRGR